MLLPDCTMTLLYGCRANMGTSGETGNGQIGRRPTIDDVPKLFGLVSVPLYRWSLGEGSAGEHS